MKPTPPPFSHSTSAPMERPLSFATDMLKAVRSGIKTQTRRPVYPQDLIRRDGRLWRTDGREIVCPFGTPGDRLWVRERFASIEGGVVYSADPIKGRARFEWQQSRYLPRQFSRVLLEVVAVRSEQLQSISQTDARAEGYPPAEALQPIDWFHRLWDRLTMAELLRWPANPWVWAVEFRVLSGRTDMDGPGPLFDIDQVQQHTEEKARSGKRLATIEEKQKLAKLLQKNPGI